jgi:isopenicillin-N N-acyltransferase like protein
LAGVNRVDLIIKVCKREKTNIYIFSVLVPLIILIFCNKNLNPCTLWGAAGESSASGGTIIAKNRDWAPDHTQKLKIINPKKGNRYFGLFADGNNDSGIKAGINDKGLSVISASASSIPRKVRDTQTDVSGIISGILVKYNFVDELLADKEIFSHTRAGFLFVSDKKKIAIIEIGFEGISYSVKSAGNGIVFHTNHYLDEKMQKENRKIGKSSLKRLDRIGNLLANAKPPYTVDIFKKMSMDQSDGPDNSIWRAGSTLEKERTLSTWIAEAPLQGYPRIYIKLANPGEVYKEYNFTIDERFWERKFFEQKI